MFWTPVAYSYLIVLRTYCYLSILLTLAPYCLLILGKQVAYCHCHPYLILRTPSAYCYCYSY